MHVKNDYAIEIYIIKLAGNLTILTSLRRSIEFVKRQKYL